MAVSMDKQYRTRDGREVRIYAVDGCGDYPIHGAIKKEVGWDVRVWPVTGLHDSYENIDLIEVKPRIKREYWLNVYETELSWGLSISREMADKCTKSGRIACVKVVIDCEEGEGL